MVCQELQRYGGDDRRELLYDLGHLYDMVGNARYGLVATGDYGYAIICPCVVP